MLSFLLDTNIVIALDPIPDNRVEHGSDSAAEFLRLAFEFGAKIYLHPVSRRDHERDTCEARLQARMRMLGKYVCLPAPPPISDVLNNSFGSPPVDSNDWVDLSLLEALRSEAVHYLVTEDHGIHRKARIIGLGERIANAAEAADILRRLLDISHQPLPPLVCGVAHELNSDDGIFDSLRQDYPGFDKWLVEKCKRQQRKVWYLNIGDSHAGVAIVKPEKEGESGYKGKTLKLCSFKVGEPGAGRSIGELMLQAVLEHATENSYDQVYLRAFPRHEQLIGFMESFGFERDAQRVTEGGEFNLKKSLRPPAEVEVDLTPLEYHIRYGPHELMLTGCSKYIVPVQPRFSDRLFPETAKQRDIVHGIEACGNAIRKAYLCNAQVRSIREGDCLLFYCSKPDQVVQIVAVVEQTFISSDADAVAAFAGKRTVYPYKEIQNLCRKGDVLVILFRQARRLSAPVSLDEMIQANVLSGAPQSIQKLGEGCEQWLKNLLARSP